jgi:uncharacterized protein YcfJ
MMGKNKKVAIYSLVALATLAGVAVASSYVTRSAIQEEKIAEAKPIQRTQPSRSMQHASAQPARQPCNDHNIVGTVIGGVAGGVVGNQFGKGSGRTVTTVGGAAGGAYLGNQYLNTRGAACN